MAGEQLYFFARDSLVVQCANTVLLHLTDWMTVAVVFLLFGALEYKAPFHRMFLLSDPNIQYPFAEQERVPALEMLV